MNTPAISELQLIQKLAKKSKLEIYLVGGYVRDYLLDKDSHDFDFTVSKNALKFAKTFADTCKGALVILDEQQGCARVVKKIENQIFTFDFADFRAGSLRADLNKRDFTINTLYVDFLKWRHNKSFKTLIRGSKQAKRDLQNKIIRMVSAKTFEQDPLRLMRAYSLQATLSFKIDPLTKKQIKQDVRLLQDVSLERVRDELFKVLKSNKTYTTFKAMDRIKLLPQVIPQVSLMYNVHQGGYHHLDVWKHSLEVVNQLEKILKTIFKNIEWANYLQEELSTDRPRYALMKLGALLHDVGKPDTKQVKDGKMSFHSHEHVGKRITKIIGKDLKLSIKERHALEDMVQWHLRPGYLSNFKCPSDKSIFRYFRDTKKEAVSILWLSLADQRSTCGPLTTQHDQEHHEQICLSLVNAWFEKQKEKPKKRLLTGNDLIKTFKLKPSPEFAKILDSVEEAQALGKIKTKKEASALVAKMI